MGRKVLQFTQWILRKNILKLTQIIEANIIEIKILIIN